MIRQGSSRYNWGELPCFDSSTEGFINPTTARIAQISCAVPAFEASTVPIKVGGHQKSGHNWGL